MAQLTVYIDENTLKKIHTEAKREGTSVSKWVKSKLEASLTPKGWPPGYFDVFGSLKDDDSFKPPEELPWSDDDIPSFDDV